MNFACIPKYIPIEKSVLFAYEPVYMRPCSDSVFIRFRMSSTRQAVHRADIFIGFGNRPVLTPSHQQVLPMGISSLI